MRTNVMNCHILCAFCGIVCAGREEPILGMFRSMFEAILNDIDSVFEIFRMLQMICTIL